IALVSALLVGVYYMNPTTKSIFSSVAGNLVLLIIIITIILGGVYKKVSVLDAFIEGAKEGFNVVLKIIPYLVGMLVGIRVFRDSGALDYIINGISYLIHAAVLQTDYLHELTAE